MIFLLLISILTDLSHNYATLMEAHRRDSALSVPIRSTALDAVASSFAEELARTGRLTHIDQTGRGPEHRAGVVGMGYVGEVLGFGTYPGAVFRAWLASPGHRQILDDSRWIHYGAGTHPWKNGHVAVLIFWSPP